MTASTTPLDPAQLKDLLQTWAFDLNRDYLTKEHPEILEARAAIFRCLEEGQEAVLRQIVGEMNEGYDRDHLCKRIEHAAAIRPAEDRKPAVALFTIPVLFTLPRPELSMPVTVPMLPTLSRHVARLIKERTGTASEVLLLPRIFSRDELRGWTWEQTHDLTQQMQSLLAASGDPDIPWRSIDALRQPEPAEPISLDGLGIHLRYVVGAMTIQDTEADCYYDWEQIFWNARKALNEIFDKTNNWLIGVFSPLCISPFYAGQDEGLGEFNEFALLYRVHHFVKDLMGLPAKEVQVIVTPHGSDNAVRQWRIAGYTKGSDPRVVFLQIWDHKSDEAGEHDLPAMLEQMAHSGVTDVRIVRRLYPLDLDVDGVPAFMRPDDTWHVLGQRWTPALPAAAGPSLKEAAKAYIAGHQCATAANLLMHQLTQDLVLDDTDIPWMLELLRHREKVLLERDIVRYLGQMQTPAALDALRDIFDLETCDTHLLVIEQVGRYADLRALPLLLRWYDEEADPRHLGRLERTLVQAMIMQLNRLPGHAQEKAARTLIIESATPQRMLAMLLSNSTSRVYCNLDADERRVGYELAGHILARHPDCCTKEVRAKLVRLVTRTETEPENLACLVQLAGRIDRLKNEMAAAAFAAGKRPPKRLLELDALYEGTDVRWRQMRARFQKPSRRTA